MAQRTKHGASTLSQAAGGERLPTLPVALAYVDACGGDTGEWEERWREAAAEVAATPRAENGDAQPPYRGLARFEPGDADLFFGRDEITDRALEMTRSRRFTAVLGPSGSGKSSLLRAGLVPRLRHLDQHPDQHQDQTGPPPVALRILTPGPNPLRAHAQRLDPADGDGDTWLIVDQFEELYTLCHDPAERDRFIDRLLAATDPASRLRVVIAVRADFLGRCAEHPALTAALQGATVLVGPMSRGELREAVTRPAQAAGAIVERALTTRVLDEVEGEPGALPLMSHALLETWRCRKGRALTLEAYESVGGLRGAIARTAEDIHDRLTPAQADLARRILLRLVTPGDGVPDTRRPARREEFDFGEATDTTTVVERLARARLLTLDEEQVGLAHEALISAWPRLRNWIDTDRERLRAHRRLTEAAAAWDALARDPGALYRGTLLAATEEAFPAEDREAALTPLEGAFLGSSLRARRRERVRPRILAAVLSILVALALTAGLVAWQQNRTSTVQRTQTAARRVAALAESLRYSDPVTAERLSVAAWRIADTIETRSALIGALAQKEEDAFTPSGDEDSQYFMTPDTRTLVATGGHRVVRWDVRTHRRTGVFGGLREDRALEASGVSPDGRYLLLVGTGRIRVWDIAAGRYAGATAHAGKGARHGSVLEVNAYGQFDPSGRTINVSGGPDDDNHVQVWDWRRHRLLFERHGARVQGVVVSPDDRFAAVCETGRPLRVWDMTRHRMLSTSGTPRASAEGGCAPAEFSPDSHRLVAAMPEGGLRLWNLTSGTSRSSEGSGAPGTSEGSRVPGARGSTDVSRAHDIPGGFRDAVEGSYSDVTDMAFSRDGRFLATTNGQEVRLWRLSAGASGPVFRYFLPAHGSDSLGQFGLDPDGRTVRYLVATAEDQAEGTMVRAVSASGATAPGWRDDPLEEAEFSPDGRTLATTWRAGRRSHFRLTDARSGRVQADLPATPCTADPDRPGSGPEDCGELMSFSADGTTFACTASVGEYSHTTQRVTVWDVHARRVRATVDLGRPTHARGVINAIALGPDGRTLLVSRLRDADIRTETWDVSRGRRTGALRGAGGDAVAVRPDGRLLATSYGQLGDLSTRHVVGRRLAQDSTMALAFSPDGRHLAAGDRSGRVTLWDGRAAHRLAVLAGTFTETRQDSGAAVSALAFSSDSRTLAVGGDDGTLQLWDVPSGRRLGSALPTAGEPVLAVAFGADGGTLRTSGRYLTLHGYPTDPSSIGTRTCRRTGGGLTRAEWEEYVPELPYRDTC
ncbi:nSTAND1 domain-containing NTPase [Streptomyces collinus]|uniref:nSTAND1 domain-containing NTPase n=1 Tax=Streptomyces collinus TaxID=42684 RepID=UPI0033C1BCA1